MISSMTGFARRETSGPFGQLACELRSVNHRFFEPSLRLPEEFRAMESELRQSMGQVLKRGKIDCTVHFRPAASAERALDLDEETLARVLRRADEIRARLSGSSAIDIMEVLRWPGVVRDAAPDREALHAALRELFAAALADIVSCREREGAHLAALTTQRCDALQTLVAQVRTRLPEVQARVRSRLLERLGELRTEINQERLEQELVLLLQRLDVAEELDRLTGHLAEARRVMAAKEPAGRRLDFLMQEFNREANTLSSKSQDLETTRLALDMKVLIEQMREQVQNIE